MTANSNKMDGQHWAGSITVELISQQGISAWATEWLNRAIEAEKKGNQLVIYEVPPTDMVYLSAGPESEQMLVDVGFLQAIRG